MDREQLSEWMEEAAAAHLACAGVPTADLTPGRMAELIRENAEMREALLEAEKDLVAYQVNARHANRYDAKWDGCAEAVQPTIDRIRALPNGEAS
jgi:hypothetical protein